MHQAPYYWDEITPILKENKVIYFTHADSRLANNDLPDDIQKLRCRVNYGALKYAEPIRQLADTLINRMQEDSPYIALHLRCGELMLWRSHALTQRDFWSGVRNFAYKPSLLGNFLVHAHR